VHALSTCERRERGRALIIVADDDELLRELIAAALERDGYDVHRAACASHVIDLIHAARRGGGRVDLVLTDLCMPGIDGLSLLKLLRDADVGAEVIVMTAFADASVREEAGAYGAALVDKPILLATLRGAVEAALRRALDDAPPMTRSQFSSAGGRSR